MIVTASQPVVITRDQTDTEGLPAANTHTAVLWKNGAATAEVVTPGNPSTGVYSFAWTIPDDAVADDVFSLRVVDGDGFAATVWEGCVGRAAALDSAARTELLQAMVTEDTGETTASAGSVAKLAQANITATQLAAITVESGVIANFPETLTIGDSYTSNTGQIKIAITDADGDPITGIGSLDFVDATISFTAFRPNDSASISGICQFVDDITETYVLLTLPSTQTALGKAEYTYEGRLVFFWEGASSGDYDNEQKTYKTTPFKFIANP